MKSVWDEMQEEARAKGIAKGIAKGREDIASRMIKSGELAFSEIAEYTGLELARVQEIAKAL